jgi:hypothetical protein
MTLSPLTADQTILKVLVGSHAQRLAKKGDRLATMHYDSLEADTGVTLHRSMISSSGSEPPVKA